MDDHLHRAGRQAARAQEGLEDLMGELYNMKRLQRVQDRVLDAAARLMDLHVPTEGGRACIFCGATMEHIPSCRWGCLEDAVQALETEMEGD